MMSVVHGLEAEYWGQIDFVYLDIDAPGTEQFKQALGYVYQPHYFLLDSAGNVLAQWIGPVQGAVLRGALNAALQ